MDDEYVCLTIRAHPGETEATFRGRLSQFWTHLLRTQEETFGLVYAETTKFETIDGRPARKYLLHGEAADLLEAELSQCGMAFDPIDRDDVYSKYEASPPDWMQIEH